MFELDSPEQSEIRESVRRLARSEVPRFQKEQFYSTVPRELFKLLGSIGLTGLSIEEQYGGSSSDAETISLVIEELARIDAGPAVFLSVHLMSSKLIQRYGTDKQKKDYLPGMASGDLLGAFALSESSAGSDAAALKTKFVKSVDSYCVNGSKCWITSAGFADLYVTFARAEGNTNKDGISAFIITPDSKGFTVGAPEKKMGCELSPIGTLEFENCSLPDTSLLGAEGRGYAIALSGLAGGRVNIGSCAIGISEAALAKAHAHLQEREQFGKKLIDMQGLQFMLADMKIKLEAARMLTWRAARTLSTDPDALNARIHPSIAKCFASDACMQITTDAVQLMGAAGYMKDYEVERLMRDAKMLQIVEGTNQIQRLLIAREL